MTLEQLYEHVAELSIDEMQQLMEYIERHKRAKEFLAAVEALQEGLTEQEIEEIVEAINYEYIEPFNEEEWRD